MKNIIIAGAGTYGKEALWLIQAQNSQAEKEGREKPYRILGFIDDNPDTLKGTGIDIPILGGITEWKPVRDERYVLGAAFPEMKVKISSMLRQRGCRFETVIAPWSRVSPYCQLGEGCVVTAVSIGSSAKLGDFVNAAGCAIAPGAVIDDYCTVTGFAVVEDAYVGKQVFIGSHAVVSAGVHVGEGAKVSVGSIVTENVKAGETVFGVPAKGITA